MSNKVKSYGIQKANGLTEEELITYIEEAKNKERLEFEVDRLKEKIGESGSRLNYLQSKTAELVRICAFLDQKYQDKEQLLQQLTSEAQQLENKNIVQLLHIHVRTTNWRSQE